MWHCHKGVQMVEAKKKNPGAPYISFKTLLNLAERLEPEPPPKIDKSVVAYLSGGYSAQLLAALKMMGLIDEQGTPTPEMLRFVSERDSRIDTVKQLWHTTYEKLLERVDISKATQGQLEEAFTAEYDVTGDTRRKAIVFFIHGCQYASITLSSLILETVKRTRSINRRRRKGIDGPTDEATPPRPPDNLPPQETIKVHPMLMGAIQWLYENGPHWTQEQAKIWSDSFVSNVNLVYPPESSNVGTTKPPVEVVGQQEE